MQEAEPLCPLSAADNTGSWICWRALSNARLALRFFLDPKRAWQCAAVLKSPLCRRALYQQHEVTSLT